MKVYSSKLAFEEDWNNSNVIFTMKTSGSTGEPKEIILDKQKIIASSSATQKAILGIENLKTLCCLPTNKMGGFMQMARSVIWKSEIEVQKPSSNPMMHLKLSHDFGLVSLSPVQLAHILKDGESKAKLFKFKVVLIGGAPLSLDLEKVLLESRDTSFYVTYGMTETYSHVALRKIGEVYYQFVPGLMGRKTKEQTLEIKGEMTGRIWLHTDDIVEFSEADKFKILGRKQSVINSGGIKFFTEVLEDILKPHLEQPFFVTKTKHEIYGEAIALVSSPNEIIDMNSLNELLQNKMGKHAKIRNHIVQNITFDPSTGKIQRVVH